MKPFLKLAGYTTEPLLKGEYPHNGTNKLVGYTVKVLLKVPTIKLNMYTVIKTTVQG